ncbi:hypothetical protein QZH41_007078 [Actinostola sp. cb2023]|nr:hypothetical protein QZH41_007078 [Actinostola sp. cb2023]
MASGFTKSQLFSILLVVLFAAFLNLPPPELSQRLEEWRYDGKYFSYQGLAVFYKDEIGTGDPNSVVVCIHGFPTSSLDWSKLNRLYTVHEQATIHEMLLKSLGIKNIHILAHDLGDTVALEVLASGLRGVCQLSMGQTPPRDKRVLWDQGYAKSTNDIEKLMF